MADRHSCPCTAATTCMHACAVSRSVYPGQQLRSAMAGCARAAHHALCAVHRERPGWLAGCLAVVAESYARIFFRNSISTGELYPCEARQRLCDVFETGDEVELDMEADKITRLSTGAPRHTMTHTARVAATGVCNHAARGGGARGICRCCCRQCVAEFRHSQSGLVALPQLRSGVQVTVHAWTAGWSSQHGGPPGPCSRHIMSPALSVQCLTILH